jgi:hypothetical protein
VERLMQALEALNDPERSEEVAGAVSYVRKLVARKDPKALSWIARQRKLLEDEVLLSRLA